jgi:hypothetical protein
MCQDLSYAVRRVSISRLAALDIHGPALILPAWPASEHTSAVEWALSTCLRPYPTLDQSGILTSMKQGR